MMLPDLMQVCRAICHDESAWIASAFYDGIARDIPQLNHNTRIIPALPSNGLFLRDGKLVVPLPPRDITRTVQEKNPGVLGRIARALWELFKLPRFYGWGFHPVSYPALEQSTLDLTRFTIQSEVSPEVSNRTGYRGVMPIQYRFTGYYDPVHDRLYWLCHEHELRRFERAQANQTRDKIDREIERRMNTPEPNTDRWVKLDLDPIGNPSPTIPSKPRASWSDDPDYQPRKLFKDTPTRSPFPFERGNGGEFPNPNPSPAWLDFVPSKDIQPPPDTSEPEPPRKTTIMVNEPEWEPERWDYDRMKPDDPPPAKWEPETDPLNPDYKPTALDPKPHDPSDFKD